MVCSIWCVAYGLLRCLSTVCIVHVDCICTISNCLHIHVYSYSEERRTKRHLYYRSLAKARFGVALPGLGYDCFRTWVRVLYSAYIHCVCTAYNSCIHYVYTAYNTCIYYVYTGYNTYYNIYILYRSCLQWASYLWSKEELVSIAR